MSRKDFSQLKDEPPVAKGKPRTPNTVTILHENGKVWQELEAQWIEPYCNDIIRIVVDDGPADILTNAPVIFEGDVDGWEHMLRDRSQLFDVSMVLWNGNEKFTHEWKDAGHLVVQDGIVSFRHKDQWVRVCGPVKITNFHSAEKP
jgi:hypothetical protein